MAKGYKAKVVCCAEQNASCFLFIKHQVTIDLDCIVPVAHHGLNT
jgi:hypothetical protein